MLWSTMLCYASEGYLPPVHLLDRRRRLAVGVAIPVQCVFPTHGGRDAYGGGER